MPHLENGSGRLSLRRLHFPEVWCGGIALRHDLSGFISRLLSTAAKTFRPLWLIAFSSQQISSSELGAQSQPLSPPPPQRHHHPFPTKTFTTHYLQKIPVVTVFLSSRQFRVLIGCISADTLRLSMNLGVGRIQNGHIESRSLVGACDRSIDKHIELTSSLSASHTLLREKAQHWNYRFKTQSPGNYQQRNQEQLRIFRWIF